MLLAVISNRGVEWESWLVGLQHKLLLGILPAEERVAPKDGDGDDALATQPSSGIRAPRRRYLYRIVGKVADFSERVSLKKLAGHNASNRAYLSACRGRSARKWQYHDCVAEPENPSKPDVSFTYLTDCYCWFVPYYAVVERRLEV